eukprot:4741463-Lingulodinium_polyedra.AAC.1
MLDNYVPREGDKPESTSPSSTQKVCCVTTSPPVMKKKKGGLVRKMFMKLKAKKDMLLKSSQKMGMKKLMPEGDGGEVPFAPPS